MGVAAEARRALRGLTRSPGYALIAVLTLAAGIGASVAIYTVIEHVVLEPMPYPDADRLVRVKSPVPGSGTDAEWETSTAEYFYFRDHAATADAVGLYYGSEGNLQTPNGPQRVHTARVTAGTLPLIGARAVRGRLIGAGDDRPDADAVAVLSFGFWRRQFGGDPSVIGRTVSLNDYPFVVIGIMAPGVELPPERGQPFAVNTDVWTPMRLDPAGPFCNCHVSQRMLVRLRPGATLGQAQAEFASLIPRLPDAYPGAYGRGFIEKYGFTARLYRLKDYVVGDVAGSLWIVFGAVGVVLLIAFANAANLFLVRTETRRREIAVRAALGARRGAIVRHFLGESVVLAALGAALGILVGYGALKWLLALAPTTLPRLDEVRFDASVYAFAAAVAVLVAGLLALFPLLYAGRTPAVAALGDGGRGGTTSRERQRVRSSLVVAQVALALVLIVAAGLLVQSVRRLRAVDPGFRADGVVTARLTVSPNRYRNTAEVWGFYRAMLERVRELPGVTGAGLSEAAPLGGNGCTVQAFQDASVYDRVRDTDHTTCAAQESTSPGYFEALGIPVLEGRTLTAADNDQPGRGAVVVSKAFADRFWPGEDAIGKGVSPNGRSEGPFYHVVGVVGDVAAETLDGDPLLGIYYPVVRIPASGGWWPYDVNLVVRTSLADPLSLVPALRRAVLAVDPTVPLSDPEAVQGIVDRSMSRLSFMMVLLGLAGGVALFLAGIGLYGVVGYLVARRTGEIGIRMALGARPGQVVGAVLSGSVRLAAAGLLAGAVVTWFATRSLGGVLYGVSPTDPLAFAAAAALLVAVALVASWLPARRAARIDPADALRAE